MEGVADKIKKASEEAFLLVLMCGEPLEAVVHIELNGVSCAI